MTAQNTPEALFIAATAELTQLAAEIDTLKATVAELVAALEMARECITYCRRTHPNAQAGEGIPVETFIDAALSKAKE